MASNITPLTPQQLQIHRRLATDLKFYAARCLKIKTKDGKLVPFTFNKAQEYIDQCLEKQKEETGMVRAIILKGRQQGCSTYIGARFFQRAAWNTAKHIYILSHESVSTQTLYGKVQTFHSNLPPSIKPKAETSNRTSLILDNASQYTVGTAGAKNTGRSQTNQFLHASEAAFYDNTDEILTGLFQTVADMDDTEIIIESTANGVGNFFHAACMDAMKGRGKFILIFVPWYWQDEYRAKVPPDWEFSEQELELQRLYNLDNEQLYWRYQKIIELKGEWKFKQEYPFSVSEAFQSSGTKFIDAAAVMRARKAKIHDPDAPVVMGVDPARQGDRTVIWIRRGRESLKLLIYDEMETMQLAGICANLIDQYNVKKCFIDFGMGYGTVDRLKELGYGNIAQGVHFGEKAMDKRYLNKRAEMAFALRDWIQQPEESVSIPDEEEVETDLLAIPDFKQNSAGLLHLEQKDKIREIYGKSPDIFDAMMLTFAYPVRAEYADNQGPRRTQNTRNGSALSALNRRASLGQKDSRFDEYQQPPKRRRR